MAPIINAIAFALPLALCCLSISISFRMLRYPDLGMTGGFVVGAYVYGVILRNGLPIFVAVLVAMLGGAVAGGLTGLLHYRLKINTLLAGIATIYMCRSVAARLALNLLPNASSRSPVMEIDGASGIGGWLTRLLPLSNRLGGEGLPVPHAAVAVAMVTAGAAAAAVFAHVRMGVVLRAFGDNREAAVEGNFPTVRLGILGLALAGVFAALGGIALMFTNTSATIDSGATILIESFAAFFLGDSLVRSVGAFVSYRYGFGQMVVTALGGTVIYQFLRNVTQILATRVGWLEATDYGFVFAGMLVLIGYLATRDEKGVARPVPIY